MRYNNLNLERDTAELLLYLLVEILIDNRSVELLGVDRRFWPQFRPLTPCQGIQDSLNVVEAMMLCPSTQSDPHRKGYVYLDFAHSFGDREAMRQLPCPTASTKVIKLAFRESKRFGRVQGRTDRQLDHVITGTVLPDSVCAEHFEFQR